MITRLYGQLRAVFPLIVVLYVPALALLGAAVAISVWTGIPIASFTRDPASLMDANPFLGVLSNVGVLLWAFCAGICFFAAAVLRAKARRSDWPAFFLFAGLITAVLLGDDFFLLHDKVLPTHLHIGESVIVPFYAVIVVGYLLRFRVSILRTHYLLLVLALGLFGLSLAVDQVPKTVIPWHHLYEDGFKLLGIVGWFGYFVSSAFAAVTSRMSAERPD
jgi:hypothetical protein